MTIATPAKIPPYIERAMQDADRVGWDVAARANSVTIKPHSRHKGIGFSLTKVPTPEQVRVQLERAGLYGALKKLQLEPTSELPEPEPEHGMAEANSTTETTDKLVCPECRNPFKSPAGLGSHRQKVHGVAGQSKESNVRRTAKKAAAKKTVAKKVVVPAQRDDDASPWFAAPEPEAVTPEAEVPSVEDAVRGLVRAVKATADAEINRLTAENAALQDFKDKVEAEVANGNQGPIQTLANIINLGGEGFGTPKA